MTTLANSFIGAFVYLQLLFLHFYLQVVLAGRTAIQFYWRFRANLHEKNQLENLENLLNMCGFAQRIAQLSLSRERRIKCINHYHQHNQIVQEHRLRFRCLSESRIRYAGLSVSMPHESKWRIYNDISFYIEINPKGKRDYCTL